jgi:D-alanyl-D-alanine carboxypeptidase
MIPALMTRASRTGPAVAAAALAAALLVAAPSSTAAADSAPDLRSIAQQLVKAGSPAAIAAVRTPTSFTGAAAGLARLEPPVPARVLDRYRVASVTKTFVATVALQLVAERKAHLSDSVERWLPGLVPDGRSITLRELLNHTSGLFDYSEDSAYARARLARPERIWMPRQLVAIAVRHKPLFRPGRDWAYSNTNYVVLGLVVESVTGRPLATALRQRIFRPLGLRSTSYPSGTVLRGHVLHGYVRSIPGVPIPRGQPLDATSLVAPDGWGAGQIVSNARDLTRFYAELLGGRLLPPAQLAAMTTRVSGTHTVLGTTVGFAAPYGLGLAIEQLGCGTAYGHDGDLPGYRNIVLARRDGRRVAAVMVNVSAARPSWATIRAAAARALCSH